MVDNFEIWYTCSSYLCRKTCAIRFSKFSLFIFSWFYVWKFRVNVSFNIVSLQIYSDTLRWKPPDAASVCRESTQILQNCETCSRSAQAPLTLKVNPLLISTCSLNTNIRCHIFRSIWCEKHVVWQPALSLCAIPFNGIPPLVRCIPRLANQYIANIRCSRNGSLDMTIPRKVCFYWAFTNETSR